MGEDTTRLRQEIEATRDDLSRDVDAVAFKASPQRIVGDRVEAAKTRAVGLKERVMGSAQETTAQVQGGVGSAVSSTSQTMHSAAETAREMPGQVAGQVTSKAQGNPLAAGLIAFGVGWLISSLLPATDAETRVAQQGADFAKDKGAPLLEQAKQEARQVGQDMAEQLRPAAQEAVESVKSTAAEGAQQVKEHGAAAAQTVKEEARSQAQDARAQHTGSSSSGTTATDESLTPVYVETVDVTGTEVRSPRER